MFFFGILDGYYAYIEVYFAKIMIILGLIILNQSDDTKDKFEINNLNSK